MPQRDSSIYDIYYQHEFLIESICKIGVTRLCTSKRMRVKRTDDLMV